MRAKSKHVHQKYRDPDDVPKITQEWIKKSNLYKGSKLVRRGTFSRYDAADYLKSKPVTLLPADQHAL